VARARMAMQIYTCSKNIYFLGSTISVPKPPVNYRTIYLKLRENGWSCVLCTSPLINSPLHLRAKCEKVKYVETSKRQYFDAPRSITYLEDANFKRQLSSLNDSYPERLFLCSLWGRNGINTLSWKTIKIAKLTLLL